VIPLKPSQAFIEGQVYFHEAGAQYYAKQGQSQLEKWSRQQVAEWREKLAGVASKCGKRGTGNELLGA
jgi:hypothetical protein